MPVDAWFPTKGKGRYRADQAILAAACLFLAGCEVPARADLRAIARDVSGASLAARLPPPGLDGPNPHLGLVPPRPERPDASFRSNVTRALEADRSRAQEPLAPRDRPAPPAAAEAPGQPPVPAAPPPPPSLARAVPVPWVAPRGAAVTPLEPSGEPLAPGAVPAAPPPELLAPAVPSLR